MPRLKTRSISFLVFFTSSPSLQQRDNDLNIDKPVDPIEEEFDEKQPEQLQEPPEKDLQFMLGNSTCVDDPKDLDSQNVTTLEEFILSMRFALLLFNIKFSC